MKGNSGINESVKVNLVTHDDGCEVDYDQEVRRLWDLETIGIEEGDKVHEALMDKITFDGGRYSVKLP